MAAEAGADAFGMIFAPSPRRISFESAQEIARRAPPTIAPVAVFVNPADSDVDAVRELFPNAFLQFSGDETPEFVGRYGDRAIKAIHIDDRTTLVQSAANAFRQPSCSSTRARTEWRAVPAARSIGIRSFRSSPSGASSLREV
jgi:phosphoribosylanthranilate isomerase